MMFELLKRNQHYEGDICASSRTSDRSLPLIAAPLLASAAPARRYSTRAVDLVTESNILDMLGLLTLNWSLLDQWHRVPRLSPTATSRSCAVPDRHFPSRSGV